MSCTWCIVLLVIVIVIALIFFWKSSIKSIKWNESYACLVGKTAIVTGGNTGIGYITALDFAKRGARVILACRSKNRAEDAQQKIIEETGNVNVLYKLVDMSSLQSVRNFAEDINRTEERLDILVNNAGVGCRETGFTADGMQTVLQVNHVSPFLITHLLFDKLKKSAPSRIVNVASALAKLAKLNSGNLNRINDIPPATIEIIRDNRLYSNSKLCNILFTTELAKKINGTGVTANALHPGVVQTEFLRGLTGFMKIMLFLVRMLFLTPEEGAQTQIYLSVSKDVVGVSGGLFTNCTQIGLYKKAKDPDLAEKLWHKTEEMAKLSANEKL